MKRRPYIAFASASLLPGNGGIARVARMSVRALAEAGYRIDSLCYGDSQTTHIAGIDSRCACGNKARFLAMTHDAALRCSHFIYDHAGIARARPRLPGLKRPGMLWIHGEEIWENLRPRAEKSIRTATRVLVNSHYTRQRYEDLHGPLPSAHVCLLATEDQPAPLSPPPGPPTLMILARLSAEDTGKGHAELIACWPEVVTRVPGARMLVVGTGDAANSFRQQAARSPVAAHITFTGFVPDEDLETCWQRTHVFAMPSRQEGFGIVYAEAMARAIPVLASVHDAGQEVNLDGETGYNISLDQPEHMVDRIVSLLGDAALRNRMGQAGRKHWETNFQYPSFRDRFLAQVDSFLGAGLAAGQTRHKHAA